ncbi:HesA/MoeB/ThiF family protein [Gallaecimonas pentaromativorans]|uniref:Sulfur carrier protein ThiS adenylyltransferase n=1 Tax=Gallaecimonas pentaromativorans TaxID=584787 RepID=A0A3N1NG25_9GAMM|nr:HesA/MoeB/ThiF family protein [Gallaecimonas pentaromativorans]ROQ18854.1 sulfur carrier protein ThiS adenylyltransferase [Gallaecimonas pentaromativorans]
MRHHRQQLLWGSEGQAKLAASTVAIVGLGGLGSPAALYLAGAGVGRLRLIDADKVELSNLHRQILYKSSHVGRPKAEMARRQLEALDPQCQVEECPSYIKEENIAPLLAGADLVLDCADNLATKQLLNRWCVSHGLPLVSAVANRWQYRVQLVRGGPCLACLYGEAEQGAGNCDSLGVAGPLLGMAGSFQGLLAIQQLLGMAPAQDRLHLFDGQKLAWNSWQLSRDPACPVCSQ